MVYRERCRLLLACVIAFAFAALPRHAAAATTETANEVLSALAEVIKDRSRLVASQTIRNDILSELCRGTLTVTSKSGEVRELKMGGSDACKADPHTGCTADDQFVDSCTVLDTLDAPLTDPTYLKRFGRDALRFGFRIGGAEYDAELYAQLDIAELADFVYNLLDLLSQPDVSPSDLANPLLAFADHLGDERSIASFKGIAALPQTRALLQQKLPPLGARVAEAIGDLACRQLAKDPDLARTSPTLYRAIAGASSLAKQKTPACAAVVAQSWQWLRPLSSADDCQALRANDLEPLRQLFRELFLVAGAPLEAGFKRSCDQLPAEDVSACHGAMLAMRLYPPLARSRCSSSAQGSAELSQGLRNLYFLFGGRDGQSVPDALKAYVPGDEAIEQDWLALGAEARRQLAISAGVGQYELASTLRLTGSLLQAYQTLPTEVEDWLTKVQGELELGSGNADPLAAKSLLWASRPTLPAPLRDVRDALVNVLMLPRLRLALSSAASENEYYKATKQVALAIGNLARFAKAQNKPAAKEDAIRRFAQLLRAQAAIVGATAQVEKLEKHERKRLERLARLLENGADVSERVAESDWVGVAVVVSDQARDSLKSRKDLTIIASSLAFSRVLLSAYQSKSKEDAKAVFEAALEDVASRERRYARWTVDIAALAAARGGLQRQEDDTRGYYGMFAPVGAQVACQGFGLLLYPVDVGAYLVDSGSAPESSEAVRFGLASYARFSSSVPIVLGLGGDYRPAIEDRAQAWRAHAFIALELPLYTIH
jgi:hypothetical protein